VYDSSTTIFWQREIGEMKKWINITVIILLSFIIVACNQNNHDVTEEINKHIEDTVEIELHFEESQKKISQLEEEDEEIYERIIQLGTEDYDEIIELSDKAVELLEEREEIVEQEKDSIESAKEEFLKIEPLIEKVEDDNQKDNIQKMYDAMIARYESYDAVYDNYMDSVRLTKDLYVLLKEEEFEENEVYSLISDVNDSYDHVADAFEVFNKETSSFNHFKQIYYEEVIEE